MVRIAEGEHPNDIRESNYFTETGEYSIGADASKTMLNCLMYKLCYYRFGEIKVFFNAIFEKKETNCFVATYIFLFLARLSATIWFRQDKELHNWEEGYRTGTH